jgi:hypothetical protein
VSVLTERPYPEINIIRRLHLPTICVHSTQWACAKYTTSTYHFINKFLIIELWGLHDSDCKDCGLLGWHYYFGQTLTFHRNMLPSISRIEMYRLLKRLCYASKLQKTYGAPQKGLLKFSHNSTSPPKTTLDPWKRPSILTISFNPCDDRPVWKSCSCQFFPSLDQAPFFTLFPWVLPSFVTCLYTIVHDEQTLWKIYSKDNPKAHWREKLA